MTNITPIDAYRTFLSIRHAMQGGYDINKKGITKFQRYREEHLEKNHWQKYHVQKLTREYDKERVIQIIASNLVRNLESDFRTFDESKCSKLRMYQSSKQYYIDETSDIFNRYEIKDLLNKNDSKLFVLLNTGVISPEWFCLTIRLLPQLLDFLNKQSSFHWNVIKDRLTTYKFFVTIKNTEDLYTMKQHITNCINRT